MAGYADIEKIEKLLVRGIDECGDAIISIRDVRKAIAQAKTADVQEVRHGKWLPNMEWFDDDYGIEPHEERYQNGWKCSLCGRIELIKEAYCHCGAKMDRKET